MLNHEYNLEGFGLNLNGVNPIPDKNRIDTVTLQQLYDSTFETRPAIIKDFLYPGLYIFAGDPKIGKSFFVTQLAFHVSTGKDFWNMEVKQGTVLYLALEDRFPRLQERTYRMFGEEETEKLNFAIEAKKSGEGLEDQIKYFIKNNTDCNLIIIDTLKKIREENGELSYSKDYDFISKMKSIADEYGVCILLVHHSRKNKTDDPFDDLNGTNGLSGAADGTFSMRKENRLGLEATLYLTGRDTADTKFTMRKNPETLIWELVEMNRELWKEIPDPIIESVVNFVKTNHQWSGTASELVEQLQLEIAPNSITKKLNVNASLSRNEHNIYYTYNRSGERRNITLKIINDSCDSCDG